MNKTHGDEETESKVKRVKVDEHAPDREDARGEVHEEKGQMKEVGDDSGGISHSVSQLMDSSLSQGVEVCSLSCIFLNCNVHV